MSEIAVRPAGGNELELLKEQVRLIQQTDFVPKALRGKPHAILACILYGREMGLGPMKSLQEIDMIDGSPTESAAIVAAKIRAAGHRLWREEHRDEDGTVTGITAHGERSDGTRDSFTFTLSMAQRANLLGKNNWKTYPEAMLWARACTQLARFLFSDVFLGTVYTREEIGASDTDENGAAIEGQVWDAAETAQEPGSDVTSPAPAPDSSASQAQHAKLAVIIHELEAADTPLPEIPDEEIKVESWEDYSRWHAFQEWGVESRSQLSKGEMSRLIEHMQSMRVPFA